MRDDNHFGGGPFGCRVEGLFFFDGRFSIFLFAFTGTLRQIKDGGEMVDDLFYLDWFLSTKRLVLY